jgi:predicted MFS family arabinose efflux permease
VLPRPAAFGAITLILGAVLVAASAPTPLYPVYQQRFDFTPTTLTVVFAVYALALIAALLLTGALSDRVGRRPVLLAALASIAVSMAVFALADSVTWLVVARVLQGIGTGVATGTLSATLLDLQPRPGTGPMVSSAAPALGLAVGALLAGALVQHGPAPRQLLFWLLLAVFVVAAAAVLGVPETVPYDPAWAHALRPRVGVPAAARATFLTVGPLIAAAWALAGFYLSLGPSLAMQLSGSTDRLVSSLPAVALFGAGGVATVLTTRWAPQRALLAGSPLLVAGVLVTLAGLGTGQLWLYALGSAAAGAGFGPAFAGALRTLAPLAATTERAALLTAVYVLSYLSFSVPAVLAGVATTRAGLRDTADVYAAVVAVVAAAATAGYTLRTRRLTRGGAPPPAGRPGSGCPRTGP